MRKTGTLFFALCCCLLLSFIQSVGQAEAKTHYNLLTSCYWLTPGGKLCQQSQFRSFLFASYKGPLIGCKSRSGHIDYSVPNYKPLKRRGRPVVALSFDDGPSIYTKRYLKILAREKIRAAFFLVGQQASNSPYLVQQELKQGHMIGNHSWNHPMLTYRTTRVSQQLLDTQDTIQKISGFKPCLMRPPYGAWNQSVQTESARRGLEIVLWDVDSRDWSKPGTAHIVRNVVSGVKNGSIVLMHDGGGDRSQGLVALPQIIHILRQRGFRFIRLDQLLKAKLSHSGGEPVR